MRRLLCVLLLLLLAPSAVGLAGGLGTLPPSAFSLHPSASLPPTATSGPTEAVGTATLAPTFVLPTVKPPRPSYTPSATATPSRTATRTRTPSPTRTATRTATATRTRTPTPTPAPIYYLQTGDNWIEAEHPTNDQIGAWSLRSDGAASGGYALIATTNDAGTLEYRFQLDYAGTIAVWLRAIRAPTTDKPIRIRLDTRGDDPATVRSTAWEWTLDDDATYDIEPGLHTFTIDGEAGGVQIDQILVTTDLDTAP